MTLNFQRLETEVAELSSVVDGVVKLLTDIAAEIRDNAANQVKIESLADQIDTKAQALAAAAAANTPSEEPPVEPPVGGGEQPPSEGEGQGFSRRK